MVSLILEPVISPCAVFVKTAGVAMVTVNVPSSGETTRVGTTALYVVQPLPLPLEPSSVFVLSASWSSALSTSPGSEDEFQSVASAGVYVTTDASGALWLIGRGDEFF